MANFEKLSKLCEEIAELEKKVREAVQNEFKPALKEVMFILKDEAPQVKELRWAQYVSNFDDFTIDGVYFSFRKRQFGNAENINSFIASTYDVNLAKEHKNNPQKKSFLYNLTDLVANMLITHDQALLMNQLSNTINELKGVTELAFGIDVEITLNIDSGELSIKEREYDY